MTNSKNKINSLSNDIKEKEKECNEFRNLLKEKFDELNELKKQWKGSVNEIKELKKNLKHEKKNKVKNKRKKSFNGFTKPVKITKKLQKFLKLDSDITTRNYVWKNIYKFIKDNDLIDVLDKRYFFINNEYGDSLKNALDLDINYKNSIYSIRKNIENNIIK